MATLLTLVAPRYWQQVDTAKEAVLRENLRLTRDAIGKFFGDSGRYPDSLEELVTARYLSGRPFDPLTDSTDTWIIEAAPEGQVGAVYDLHSGSRANARDGTPYASW